MASEEMWQEFLDTVRDAIRLGMPKEKLIGDMVAMIPPMEGVHIREALEAVWREMKAEVDTSMPIA